MTTHYLPRGNLLSWQQEYFLCRHCYGNMPYGSQYESASDRMWRRYHEMHNALESLDPSSRKWVTIARDLDKLMPFLTEHMRTTTERQWASLERLTPRKPGRPSKREERERLRSRRAAERAAKPQRGPGRPRAKRSYQRRVPLVLTERSSEMEAYCPKCRDRRELTHAKRTTFRNGRPAVQGKCGTCGTKMARIVKEEKITN